MGKGPKNCCWENVRGGRVARNRIMQLVTLQSCRNDSAGTVSLLLVLNSSQVKREGAWMDTVWGDEWVGRLHSSSLFLSTKPFPLRSPHLQFGVLASTSAGPRDSHSLTRLLNSTSESRAWGRMEEQPQNQHTHWVTLRPAHPSSQPLWAWSG